MSAKGGQRKQGEETEVTTSFLDPEVVQDAKENDPVNFFLISLF